MKNGRLKLGIVGGLGARGGADILNKLVAETPVKSEGDHREILFEQRPLSEPTPVSSAGYAPIHRKFYVYDTLVRMEQSGCDAALLPCFITHTFLDELATELPIELISLGDAVAHELALNHSGARRAGILTTPYVRRNEFFERLLSPNMAIVYPETQAEASMLKAIYGANGFKSGGNTSDILVQVEGAVRSLIKRGADVIIPGMTELPILFNLADPSLREKIIDVNEVYARFALERTTGRRPATFKIGIVGGVGPAATVDFLGKVIRATNADRDQDHVKLIVEQNPQIPDRTENLIKGGPDPTIALYSTCKKLERAGAQVIAIPCNTAHAFIDRIQRHLETPIISILTETVVQIQNLNPTVKRVAVLATSGTIASQLYQAALEEKGLVPVVPDTETQKLLMEVIYGPEGVKAGYSMGRCAVQLADVIKKVASSGAEVAILGCTELPLVEFTDGDKPNILLIDPTDALAKACVNAADIGPVTV